MILRRGPRMPTVRLAVLALLVALAAVPGAALGHSARDVSANTMKLSSAVRMCSAYTPKAEARLNRIERQVLGGAHAAEHARSRAQGRRQACAPGGKLKRGFVAKVRKMARSRAKRSHATGLPSVVGQWSGLTHSDVTGVHGVLLPTGKVLYFSYGVGDTGIASIWDPVTNTSHRVDPPAGAYSPHDNIWCAGQTLLADGRVVVVGGNIPKTGDEFRGLDTIYLFDPWTETWALQGRMREGRWYPTATQLPNNQVVITSGQKRDGSGTINPDVEVFTPNPDPTKVGTITYVGEMSWNLYPRQNVVKDGRVLVSGPGAGDTGLLNPANWTWSSVPRLASDHFYGGAVLLPSGPGGSSQVLVIAGDQSSTTEVLDTANLGAGWSFRASLPQVRRNANSVLTPDGAIITIGGNGANNFDSPRFEALRYDPAANTWTELAAQAEPRGYHSTALLLPDGRIVSAGDDGPTGGGGQSDEFEVFSPPYLFKGAAAHHHLGAHPGRLRRSVHRRIGRDERHERRAGGPGRDHPRLRPAPAARAARHVAGDRRLRPHRPRLGQHRPAGLLHALPGQQRWRALDGEDDPPRRGPGRRRPAERGRLGPGGRRHRLGHHPGERQRLRQRRRGRGPVHPRRGQPGRRGHQRPLLGQLEHHHRRQRPPHAARDRPRRGRQLGHLGGRRRDGLERRRRPAPAWWPPTASRRPRAPRSPTPRARTTPARSSTTRPAPPRARSAGRSTSTGSTTTSRWPTPTRST